MTAAPLLGLLGTIIGMMHSFRLIGGQGVVNPTGVTGGVAQALIATAIGLVIALAATRGLSSFLFGVSAFDPIVFSSVTLALVGAALVATLIPARRATRVDPLVALRND